MNDHYEFFISYSRADLEQVKDIKNIIERETGAHCWMDLEDIEPNTPRFTQAIAQGINASEVFLFMRSEMSQNTDFTLRELNYATNRKKKVVIVNIDISPMSDEFELCYGLNQISTWNNPTEQAKVIRFLKKCMNKKDDKRDEEEVIVRQLIPYKQDGKWGFMDKDTDKIVIPCQWKYVGGFSESMAAVANDKGMWGFINKTGNEIITCMWLYVGDFIEGLANVCDDKGKWGFINKTGEVVVPCKWTDAKSFSGGLARIKDDYGKRGYINKKGEVVIPCKWKGSGFFSEGLTHVEDNNGRWGFIDQIGTVVIPCKWRYTGDFNEGLSPILDDNYKWGYIDKTGTVIITCKWKHAWPFRGGQAKVENDNEVIRTIDKTGKVVKSE